MENMETSNLQTSISSEHKKLYNFVLYLSLFTIVYNIAEGLISTMIGYSDESLTLFGFGVDSFIETISGIGIAAMVIRITNNPLSKKSQFEITALTITGWSFCRRKGAFRESICLQNWSSPLAIKFRRMVRFSGAFTVPRNVQSDCCPQLAQPTSGKKRLAMRNRREKNVESMRRVQHTPEP